MARPTNLQARAALIEAALHQFVAKGLEKSRVEDITHHCGLSKGAFYLHFNSKEALFAEQVNGLVSEINLLSRRRRAPYRKLVAAASGAEASASLIKRLADHDKKFDVETLEALWRNRSVVDVLYHGSRGTEFENVVWDFVDAETKRVCQELKHMRRLGLCRDDLPDEIVAAHVIGGWALLSRQMVRLKRKPDLERWVDSLSSMLYQGISFSDRSHLPLGIGSST